MMNHLSQAAKDGRADTRKGGPWKWSWQFDKRTWEAYCTGLHREACPGSGNRTQRREGRKEYLRVQECLKQGIPVSLCRASFSPLRKSQPSISIDNPITLRHNP